MRAVRNRRPVRSVADLHRMWLALVDTEGPFLSVPVLRRVYDSGIPTLDHEVAADLKVAKADFEIEWDRHDKGERSDDDFLPARDAWIDLVLRRAFGWADYYTTDPTATVEIASPKDAVAHGLSLATEDRKGQGLLLDMSCAENITITDLARVSEFGLLNRADEVRNYEVGL